MKCPECKGSNVVKKGWQHTDAGGYQRYKCKDCDEPVRAEQEQIKMPGGMLLSEIARLMNARWT